MRRYGKLSDRKKPPQASGSETLIDVERTDLERLGYEPLVIDWRTAKKRKNGYSARMMGYPETHLSRAKAHVRTKDIGGVTHDSRGRPYSKYRGGLGLRMISPRAEEGIVKYYLSYGVKIASQLLGLPGYILSAVAHRNGVQRNRGQAVRFYYQGKSEVRHPTPDDIRSWNAEFMKERRAYYKSRAAIHVLPDGFADVPGWEGHYAVSRDGRVWSYPPPGKRLGRFITPSRLYRSKTDRWRRKFTLIVILGRMVGGRYETKNITLAQLVARTFIPNPDGRRFVHVKDGNPANCNIDNLVWMSGAEMAKLGRMKRSARAAVRLQWVKGKTLALPHLGPAPDGFKDIPGWDGLYAASRDGRVWSYPRVRTNGGITRGRIMKPSRNGKARGYLFLVLSRDGRTEQHQLNRLIATTFVPQPEGRTIVHVKNAVTDDCRADNLEWISTSEAMRISEATKRREREMAQEGRGWALNRRSAPPTRKRPYTERWEPDDKKKTQRYWERNGWKRPNYKSRQAPAPA